MKEIKTEKAENRSLAGYTQSGDNFEIYNIAEEISIKEVIE
jgi:hypothetical protein